VAIESFFPSCWGLQYRIVYKKGADNKVADALSRNLSHYAGVALPATTCNAMPSVQPKWVDEIVTSYDSDSFAKEMIASLFLDPNASPGYSWTNGVLRYKSRIWVGSDKELHNRLINARHSSAVEGNLGILVTYRRMKQLFTWRGMKGAMQQFVQSCLVCQVVEPDRTKSPGLLQPLPVPEGAWQTVLMDFVEGLSQSNHADCVMVLVVDKFTKYAHFVALKHPFIAASVAKLFLDQIYMLHGMPTSTISDRDRVFTTRFWQELFGLAKVQLCMGTTYHPQSDGQTERVNQCMEMFLRCFVSACPHKWHVVHYLSTLMMINMLLKPSIYFLCLR
jgi:hypothetical protein